MRLPLHLAPPTALAAALALAACGRGDTQSANGAGADTSGSAQSGATITPVGSMKPQMDSGLARGERRIDSLHQAGVGTKNGLDSTISRVQAATANDPQRDSGAHINNRATPGAGPAAPAGTAPGSKRP